MCESRLDVELSLQCDLGACTLGVCLDPEVVESGPLSTALFILSCCFVKVQEEKRDKSVIPTSLYICMRWVIFMHAGASFLYPLCMACTVLAADSV